MSTKIAEMDIHCPKRIDNLAGYDAVEILFRSGRDVIGRARIPCSSESIEANQVRALIKNLTLSPLPGVPGNNLPSVTVAICTKNRPEFFAEALRSLTRQKHPADEVIVVDNSGQPEVRLLTQEIYPEALYTIEPLPGLDFARNRAVSEASEDIIAFLDDDVRADPFWLLSIAESFAMFPQAGAVTGLVLPLELETKAQELFEDNGGFGRGFKRRILPNDSRKVCGLKLPLIVEAISLGSGCNMALKNSVVHQLNGFDEDLDTGSLLPGGGDLDLFYRLLRAGYQLVYEPRMIVHHLHRRTTAGLHQQLRGYHKSLSAFLIKTLRNEEGSEKMIVAAFILWRLLKGGYRMGSRLIGRDALPFRLLLSMLLAGIIGLRNYPYTKP